MICEPCRRSADEQSADPFTTIEHPANCGCDCQHKPVKEGQTTK